MAIQKSRRNFLKTTSAIAAAYSMGTFPTLARAAREKELNIYCWEGYNSDDVLDPFRREFDATVRAEHSWEGYNSDDVLDPFRREFDAT